ncbi:MAG: O-antigen ligase family protein [Actinomycetota bacterium]
MAVRVPATGSVRSFRLAERLALGVVALIALALALAAATRPMLVLVGLVALVVVVACTARVDLALLLLVATAPLEALFPGGAGGGLTVTKAVGLLCFMSFALNVVVTGRRLRFGVPHALVFCLLAVALLSTLVARSTADAMTTTTRYASFVALFFVVSQFVGNHVLHTRIAWVLSAASAIAGAIASWNFLSGRTLSARLPNGDPNDVAFILATTLPLTFWLLRERGPRRVAAALLLGVISVSILLTLSRGALIGLGAAVIWLAIAERRLLRPLLAGAVVAALILGLAVNAKQARIETGLQAKEKVASANVASRLEAWGAASRLAVDHPALGVGPGNFQYYFLEETGSPPGSERLRVVHDAYLDIAAELGPTAMLLFIAYLGVVFGRLTGARRLGLGPPGLAAALRVSLVVGSVSALTLSEQYFAPFWLIGGLAAALWQERSLTQRPATQ